MTALARVLVQLAAAGLLCGILLSLCGGKREVLRFGCSCLMVILILTQLRGLPDSAQAFSAEQAELRRTVEQAQADSQQKILDEAAHILEQEIVRQGKTAGITCKAKLLYSNDNHEQISIQQLELIFLGGSREALEPFRQSLAQQLALSPESITIREACTG